MGRVARDHVTALHEAAHVVVGTSAGLTLKRAEVHADGTGGTWFRGVRDGGRRRLAFGLMYAAGIAAANTAKQPWHARLDRRRLRELGFSKDDIRLLAALAARFLETDAGSALWRRVADVLVERDLTGPVTAVTLAETHGT